MADPGLHWWLHAFFRQLAEGSAYAVLLGGSTEPSPLNRWWILGLHPRQILRLQGDCLEINGERHSVSPAAPEALFEHLEAARQRCQTWPDEKARAGLPMAGGLAGAIGYGFYRWCDPAWADAPVPDADSVWPDLLLCEFEDWLLFDLHRGEWTMLSPEPRRAALYRALWAQVETVGYEDLEQQDGDKPTDFQAFFDTFNASFSRSDFENAVETIREHIRQGEIYQANLSIRLENRLKVDPYALFENLCRRNPSPFAGWLQGPDGLIVSNSPERLVRMEASGRLDTRPIAGTRGRGQTPEEDAAIGETLLTNEKELAEHRMLVDLARNDLGRICRAGSVIVDEPLVLERYSHVTHLVSNVTGEISPNRTGWDVLRALFPGGTITGCPKVRCVDILADLEPVPRGFYTGGLGYFDAASPALDWNILIRSLFLRRAPEPSEPSEPLVYNAAVHVGAGIVHDAVGAHEYRECQRKAQAVLSALRQSRIAHQPV